MVWFVEMKPVMMATPLVVMDVMEFAKSNHGGCVMAHRVYVLASAGTVFFEAWRPAMTIIPFRMMAVLPPVS